LIVGDSIKRIAFVLTGIYHISGIASVTSILANELAKKEDFEVTLITLTDRSKTLSVDIDKRVAIKKVFAENVNLKKNVVKTVLGLKKIFKESQFDIVVSPALIFYLVKKSISKRSATKLVAWDHASIPIEKDTRSLQYWIRKNAAENSDCMVVITKGAKEVYLKRYKKIKRIEQIYNTTNYKVSEDPDYNGSIKKIISAGSFDYVKGFDIAVDVAQRVLKNNPDWEWHIYGEGKEKNRIASMIKEINMEKQIKLMGRTNNLFARYKLYSFYVLPSRFESFGMVLLEAQYNNLPVVAFNCPYGPSELIKDSINGFLIETYSVELMAGKIENLIQDRELREKMSLNSRIFSNSMVKTKVVHHWEKLICSLLKG
jgi:glycosyltransferase involved in cell wall biosynthesis